jgi:hypothetical protein
MNLKEFINKKIKTGQQAEFSEGQGKNGKVVIASIDGKKYVINASIENFQRFQKWIGEKASADIKQTGKFHKTEYGFLPTIEIRTNVKVIDDGEKKKNIDTPPEEESDEEDVY